MTQYPKTNFTDPPQVTPISRSQRIVPPCSSGKRGFKIGFIGNNEMPFAPDDALLIAALQEQGCKVVEVNWHHGIEAALDLDALLMRSAWDLADSPALAQRFEHYLNSLEQSDIPVFNSARLMLWGLDKFYLRLFREATLPTVYLNAGSTFHPALLAPLNLERGGHFIIKPRIGCNSVGVEKHDLVGMLESIPRRLRQESLLVQPFEPGVFEGELSMIYIAGRFSHAVLKKPPASDESDLEREFRVQSDYGGTVERFRNPDPAAITLGELLFAKMSELIETTPDYLRVDLIFSQTFGWCLIELSMLEETLYFEEESLAAYRLARHVIQRLLHDEQFNPRISLKLLSPAPQVQAQPEYVFGLNE